MKILAAVALSVTFLGAVFAGVYLVSRPSDSGAPAPAPITAPAVPAASQTPGRPSETPPVEQRPNGNAEPAPIAPPAPA
ncbi:MAG: hypothetical protein WBQ44_10640, partial [Rhodococcus sp. (in: high G+C Gram-positive bacteria)]